MKVHSTPMPKDTQLRGGCWPTTTQQLLLRATLGQGETAICSWREWQRQTDFENLDPGSNRLLPLLWRNLAAQGVSADQLLRYRSVGRHSWVKNQMLLSQGAQLIALLENAGFATLVLKGAAVAPLYYPDFAARPMDDFDILVPTAQGPNAFEFLVSQGYQLNNWEHRPKLRPHSLSIFHANSFGKPQQADFDIHQHVFPHSHAPHADAAFWDASIPLQVNGVASRALCAEDNFLHVCAHGARWNEVPPLRWIADATLIMRGTPNFDWDRLVNQTRHHGLAIPLRQTLRHLRHLDVVAVPDEVLRELDAIPTNRALRREWASFARPRDAQSNALKLWLRGRAYTRWNRYNSSWQRPFSLPRYMQYFWGLDSLWQLPAHGLGRARELNE